MTYETKKYTFHVIRVEVNNDTPFSRNLPMNVAIESAHCGCGFIEREREREREREPHHENSLHFVSAKILVA